MTIPPSLPERGTPRPGLAGRALLLLLAGLLSAHFAMVLAKATTIFLDTGAYTHFTANRPFQYRFLMAPVLEQLVGLFRRPPLAGVVAHLPAYLARPEPLAYFFINAAAFFLALLALWPLALRAHGNDRGLRTLTVGLFVALSYLFFCLNPNLGFALPYDIPALAFTLGALWLHRRGWWPALFALFAIATCNRETILFVPIAIAIGALLTGNRRELLGAAGLGLVWLAIKAVLAVKLAHLPTEEGLRLAYNLTELVQPWQWPAIFALPLLFALTVRAALLRGPTLPFALTALAGGAMLFAVAQLTETRAFGELIPYLALSLAPLVRRHIAPAEG